MKNQTIQSTKFLKLKRRLKIPTFQVVGLLESLWILTATNTPDGGIGRRSNEDIAAFMEWDDDHDCLIEHLVETGWIDKDPVHRLVIHDWTDHAPKWVLGMMKSPATKKGYKGIKKGLEPNVADKAQGGHEAAQDEALSATPRVTPSEALSVPPCATLLNQNQNQNQNLNLNQNQNQTIPPYPPQGTGQDLNSEKVQRRKTKIRKAAIDPMAVELPFDSEAFRSAWTDWNQHRREVGKCQTAQSVAKQLKACKEVGEPSAIAAINKSIGSGWSGIFPDKSSKATGQSRETMAERLAKRFANNGGVQ